jgi:hypothetical protein
MLTKEILQENFKYDPNTGDFYWIKKAHTRNLTKPISAKSGKGYIQVRTNLSGKSKTYDIHRLIWIYMYGSITNQIDHINGIRSDNRLCNLREVTHQQNMMNQSKSYSNKTFKGIYLSSSKKRWVAEICCNYKRKYLGSFKTPEQASEAYKNAAKEIFKEFART